MNSRDPLDSLSSTLTDGRSVSVMLVTALLAVALLRAVLGGSSAAPAEQSEPIGTAAWALELLDDLVVNDDGAPSDEPYDRDAYDRWRDLDGDCQSARHEVLIAESLSPTEFTDSSGCKVAEGRWVDPYTGVEITQAAEASIDHVVSLSESHHAGAWEWSPGWKQTLFNDVDDPATLAVSATAVNGAKGSFGPDEWLPQDAEARCHYVIARVRVKTRWRLSVESSEATALRTELADCIEAGLPFEPVSAPLVIIDVQSDPPTSAPPATPVVTPNVCDVRYGAVCIPMSDQDLDCRDVVPRRFEVGALDPHSFDGDANGVGCEVD